MVIIYKYDNEIFLAKSYRFFQISHVIIVILSIINITAIYCFLYILIVTLFIIHYKCNSDILFFNTSYVSVKTQIDNFIPDVSSRHLDFSNDNSIPHYQCSYNNLAICHFEIPLRYRR